MRLFKGFTQGSMDTEYVNSEDLGRIYCWYNEGTQMYVNSRDLNSPVQSGWKYDEVPGKDNPAFSNFSLWVEYDT